jgi:hypothetical protein
MTRNIFLSANFTSQSTGKCDLVQAHSYEYYPIWSKIPHLQTIVKVLASISYKVLVIWPLSCFTYNHLRIFACFPNISKFLVWSWWFLIAPNHFRCSPSAIPPNLRASHNVVHPHSALHPVAWVSCFQTLNYPHFLPKSLQFINLYPNTMYRLCCRVVSVEDYKHRGPGFDSRALLRIFLRELGLERGPLSLVIG